MDPNLIYTKTASGEEAMRQRTRVVQRNMRMVLILVDGKSTVADLCAKTANAQMTESALRELEQGGFIEPLMAQDSVWEQSEKVAQEIKSAALAQTSPSPLAETVNEEVRTEPIFVSAPALGEVVDSSVSSFSTSPVHSVELTALDDISTFGVESTPVLPKSHLAAEPVKSPALLDRLTAFFNARKPQKADDDFSLKPIRRGGERYHLSWPIALMYGVLGVGGLIFLAAVLFPYGRYLPDVETELAQLSGQPAKVGEMHVSFYPKPGLFLSNVRLGDAGDGKGIRISEMRLLPLLGTIAAGRKVFREVELNGVSVPAEALAGLSGLFGAAVQPSAKASVQHVSLENAEISFRGLALSELSGEIKLTSDGHFDSLSLNSANRSLLFQAKPAVTGLDIELEAYGWRPSPASLFIFDSGTVKGNLRASALALSKIELRIFDGLVNGSAVLRADKQPSMAGEVSFERISARRFGEALGIGPQFEGDTTGKMKFSATADSWATLFAGLDAEGDFSTHRGALGGIDLAEAVRRGAAAPTRGGVTRFESLSGRFKLTADSYRFSGLAMNSGLMQSVGQMTLSKDLQLNGSMEVQMRGSANQLRMPVSISGPFRTPLVQAGKR
jgi:hypothetical protein